MSEPKRYDVGMTEETNSRTGFYASFPRVYEAEQGRYVEYADYARLKTEVERLTKAGDLLAVHYSALSKCVTPNNAKSGSINDWTSVIDWNAAKEGKQS